MAIDVPPMGAVIYRCVKRFPPRRKKAEKSSKEVSRPAAKKQARRSTGEKKGK